jgi:large subunit ribosomal protein L23
MIVLQKPLVTEKASALNEKGKYGFIVHKKANKVEIKKAVEKMYGVTVESVRTMNYLGKSKSRNTKSGVISGRKPSFKKAIVTVAGGEVIDFYGGI